MKKRKSSSNDDSFENGNIPRGVAGSIPLHLQQDEHGRQVESGDDAEGLGQEVEVPPEQGGASQPQQTRKRKRKRTRNKKKVSNDEGGGGEDEDGVGGATETDRNVSGYHDGGAGGGSGQFVAGIDDTIYVEGIPHSCDENDLREFFKGCGHITEIRMPKWHDTGRARGYAHVCFTDAKGAQAAFNLDGEYLNERYLTIQKPQEPATKKLRRANRGAQQPPGCRTVFVKNLPYDADEDGVCEALSRCGKIASVRLAMWNHTRKLKGFGYVEFVTERGAETCVRTQEALSVGGRPIVVDFDTGAPKGSFRRQDGAQIQKKSADAGVGRGTGPIFRVRGKVAS